jgi:hypothetical protein
MPPKKGKKKSTSSAEKAAARQVAEQRIVAMTLKELKEMKIKELRQLCRDLGKKACLEKSTITKAEIVELLKASVKSEAKKKSKEKKPKKKPSAKKPKKKSSKKKSKEEVIEIAEPKKKPKRKVSKEKKKKEPTIQELLKICKERGKLKECNEAKKRGNKPALLEFVRGLEEEAEPRRRIELVFPEEAPAKREEIEIVTGKPKKPKKPKKVAPKAKRCNAESKDEIEFCPDDQVCDDDTGKCVMSSKELLASRTFQLKTGDDRIIIGNNKHHLETLKGFFGGQITEAKKPEAEVKKLMTVEKPGPTERIAPAQVMESREALFEELSKCLVNLSK